MGNKKKSKKTEAPERKDYRDLHKGQFERVQCGRATIRFDDGGTRLDRFIHGDGMEIDVWERGSEPDSMPAYRLTITDEGIFIHCHEGAPVAVPRCGNELDIRIVREGWQS